MFTSNRSAGAVRGHKSLTTPNLTNSTQCSMNTSCIKKKSAVNISFSTFAKSAIDNSDKKQSTKDNLHSTLAVLNDFRSGLDFKDITYTFLRDFEQYLREKGNADNTIAKHMKQLRILVNEAINQGYMHADAYPFRN